MEGRRYAVLGRPDDVGGLDLINSGTTWLVIPALLRPDLDVSLVACFYAFMRTTVEFPVELFRKAKARAASRGESLKTLITRAVAAEVGQEDRGTARGRMTLPLFGNPKGRRVDLRAADIAQALADEDAVRSAGRRRR